MFLIENHYIITKLNEGLDLFHLKTSSKSPFLGADPRNSKPHNTGNDSGSPSPLQTPICGDGQQHQGRVWHGRLRNLLLHPKHMRGVHAALHERLLHRHLLR